MESKTHEICLPEVPLEPWLSKIVEGARRRDSVQSAPFSQVFSQYDDVISQLRGHFDSSLVVISSEQITDSTATNLRPLINPCFQDDSVVLKRALSLAQDRIAELEASQQQTTEEPPGATISWRRSTHGKFEDNSLVPILSSSYVLVPGELRPDKNLVSSISTLLPRQLNRVMTFQPLAFSDAPDTIVTLEQGSEVLVISKSSVCLIGTTTGQIVAVDLQDGNCISTLVLSDSKLFGLSCNSEFVVAGTLDNRIHVSELSPILKIRLVLRGHHQPLVGSGVTGRIAITASLDRTIRVWDIDRGSCVHTAVVKSTKSRLTTAALSPNGDFFCVGFEDGYVDIWQVSSGKMGLFGSSKILDGRVAGIGFCSEEIVIVFGDSPVVRLVAFDKVVAVARELTGPCERYFGVAVVGGVGRHFVTIGASKHNDVSLLWDLTTGMFNILDSFPSSPVAIASAEGVLGLVAGSSRLCVWNVGT